MSIFNRAARGGVVCLALICGSAAASPIGVPLQHAFIAFHDDLPGGIAEELNLAGVVSGIELTTIDAVAVVAPPAVLERYAQDPRVKAITPQRKIELDLYASVEQINARGVDTPELIDETTGLERPGVTGAGVTVAVIDSGIYAAHSDIVPRALEGRNFELSTLVRQAGGVLTTAEWDVYVEATGGLALQDEVGHGTHVAGIIGGDGFGSFTTSENNSGVAPGVSFVSLKIASAGNGVAEDVGFEANAVAAIDYLIRHKDDLGNVRVANNSWGLLPAEAAGLMVTDYDPAEAVVRAAVEAGIVFVFSAGNDGPDPETIRPVPNGMDEVITVASACKAVEGGCTPGDVNSFSSRGPQVDITAPGDQILSAMSPSILAPIGQTLEGNYFGPSVAEEVNNRALYIRLSGTSMSSPHVAGVVALLLEANPDLTPAQVEQILIDTATDMAIDGHSELLPGYDLASGYGLVDTRAALARAMTIGTADAGARSAPAAQAGGATGAWSLLLLVLPLLARRRG